MNATIRGPIVVIATVLAMVGGFVGGTGIEADAAQTPSLAWAVNYVGSKAAAASSSATPFTVGLIEPIGTTAGGYGGLGQIVNAAEQYINGQLDGVSGHPLKLVVCQVTDSQDDQRCGEEFANNPSIRAVVNGDVLFDDTAALQALSAKSLPVFLPIGLSAAELADEQAANYGPGLVSYFPAIAKYISQQVKGTNKTVSVLYPNNSGGLEAQSVMKEALDAVGVTSVTYVPVPVGGTAPQYIAAVRASGAQKSSIVYTGTPDTACVAIADAMKSLGVSLTSQQFLVTNGCFDSLVTSHYGGHLPSNWRVFNFGNSPYVSGLSTGVNSYLAAVKKYAPNADYGTPVTLIFGAIMSLDRIVNSLGYAAATPTATMKAMRDFSGPAFMEPGPMKCGYSRQAQAICGNETAIDRWTGTKYAESIIRVGPSLATSAAGDNG